MGDSLAMMPRLALTIAAAGLLAVPGAALAGGTLTQLGSSDVDFLDPGHSYYTAGFQVIYATNRPLYSFKPDDANNPVPDLAASAPKISRDRRTVTVRLRRGVRFGPPVNREVQAKDVKYAIERFFSVNVGGQYPGYFAVIKGTPRRPTRGARRITGIRTPNAHTLVFKLRYADGIAFAAALVMPITAPVPKEYARRFDRRNPSRYNTHVVSSGPYMVKRYRAGKDILLVRNPNWNGPATGDYRPAYLDRILLKTNQTNTVVATQQVLSGRNLVLDTNPPKPMVQRVLASGQYTSVPSGGYRYFPMNHAKPPFSNRNVRRAVMAGFSRVAARNARGGSITGDIATHFLPPAFPGFDQAGGAAGFGFDFFNDKNAAGNMAVAAKYFRKAGMKSGRYEGHHRVFVVGANTNPGKAQALVVRRQLRKLGFKVRLKLVPQDAVYTDWCQIPRKHVDMCAGAGWFKDFADPQSMLEPTFKGSLITSTGNINYSLLRSRKIDRAMNRAGRLEGAARLQAWANVDRMLVADAAAIPFLWDRTTLVRSANVSGPSASYYTAWDLSFMQVS